jgi:hypothetical protein
MRRQFDAATVKAIRAATTSHKDEALLRGCSKEAIRQIRAGIIYADTFDPTLALRPVSVSCLRCHHWTDNHCRLDFPEPVEEGPEFARECSAWVRAVR